MKFKLKFLLVIAIVISTQAPANSPEKVPPFDPATVDPSLFQGEEYVYGYYLKHLAELANSVLMEGDNRGFIDIPVWRSEQDNQPYNARVLENHVSLAFFYTTNRPWNPYHGNPALRARLEAVLDFWCSSQRSDGLFAEYGPEDWGLPATSFGIKAMGETLRLLDESKRAGGPTIDPAIHQRTIAAARLSIEALLTNPGLIAHGKRFSNQYTGFWGGALAFLTAHPDEQLRQRLVERITKLADKDNPEMITWQGNTFPFQLSSPAGYHYEAQGPDWGYVFGTNYNNLRQVWNHARGTSDVMDPIIDMERDWIEWVSYNAVRQPVSGAFILNRAIQSRIVQTAGFEFAELVLAESIPLANAYVRTRNEHQALIQQNRQNFINGWLNPPGKLTSYSPHAFTDALDRFEWRPTSAERDAAIANLPYLARGRFVHQRADNRISSTFVRRPGYYAAFNAGAKARDMQRFGLGLLWNPEMGTVLQTPSGSSGAWGTSRENALPLEAGSFNPTLKISGQAISRQPGARDIPNGESGVPTFEYGLFDGGQKTVTFNDDRIDVSIRVTGVFTEQMVLLIRAGDNLTIQPGVVRLTRNGRVFEITCPAGVTVTQNPAGGWPPQGFTATRLTLKAKDSLDYSLVFKTDSSTPTYTVSYNANGGQGSIPDYIKYKDLDLILSNGSGFSRMGYAFCGWNTAADGSGTNYAPGALYTLNEDVMLFACWRAVPPGTPLVHYKGDLTGSGFPDSSGRNNHGTAGGATQSTTIVKIGNTAMFIGGGNNSIDLAANHADFNRTYEAFTLSMWINPGAGDDVTGGSWTWFAGKMGGSSGNRGWQIGRRNTGFDNSGRMNFGYSEDAIGTWGGLTSKSIVPADQWTHFAVTFYSDQFVRMYINGVLDKEVIHSVETPVRARINGVNNAMFQVGNRGDNHSLSTLGHIDDFGLWDVALTGEQIQQIYAKGNTEGLDLQVALGAETYLDQLVYDRIDIYPNPFNTFIRINVQEQSRLNIYDVSGILRFTSILKEGLNDIKTDMLDKGLYVAEVVNAGFSYKQLIIK